MNLNELFHSRRGGGEHLIKKQKKRRKQIDAPGTTNVGKTVDSQRANINVPRCTHFCSTGEKSVATYYPIREESRDTERPRPSTRRFRLSHIWLIQLPLYRMISRGD